MSGFHEEEGSDTDKNSKAEIIMRRRIIIRFSIVFIAAVSAILLAFSGQFTDKNQTGSVGKDETVFYIIRHAETEANVNGLLAGSGSDSVLTDNGKGQARALGEGLRGIHFDSCYASEMGRTLTTAEIVLYYSDNKEVSICRDAGLNDLDWGSLEGKSVSNILSWWPDYTMEAAIGDGSDPAFVSPCGSETRYACTKRITDEMNRLAEDENSRGKRILIAAHSSMAWFIAGIAENDSQDYSSIDNASVSVLIYRNGRWEIKDFNDRDYDTLNQRLGKY